jgi:small-conductance mechanosensitive channel
LIASDFSKIWNYKPFGSADDASSFSVGQFALVLLLILVGYLVSKLIVFVLHRRLAGSRMRPDAIQVISRIVYWLILVLVFLTALSLLNIPLTAFAFITGAVAIGVGFGAQNILNNFISGWILMTEKPIRIDDFIEIEGMHGLVERIGNRSTRIRRVDGVHMLVPNSSLLEQTVINWTLIDQSIRSSVRVGVAYGSPVRKVQELVRQAVVEQDASKNQPAPVIVFEDFADSALIFDAYFWCDVAGERELRAVRSDIRFRIVELFEENDVVISFPQRDVHIDAARPIPVRMVPAEDDKE